VRGPLGKTPINKAIVGSIKDKSLHKSFPLFHNGITIIAGNVRVGTGRISASDYYVVNGCQSLTTLFENQGAFTKDLRILTKFIQLRKGSPLWAIITRFSNNQNGVRAREFMANNFMQIRLQNEFIKTYSGAYVYEIKRGEKLGDGITITNEAAGLYLMAFDLKEPWGTHRQYQVFGDKHAESFGRPEVDSDRIVMCQVMMDTVTAACAAMKINCAPSMYLRVILYSIRSD
jgi:hypothetical protein